MLRSVSFTGGIGRNPRSAGSVRLLHLGRAPFHTMCQPLLRLVRPAGTRHELQRAADRVASLGASSEDPFLTMGESLRHFDAQARELHRVATQAIDEAGIRSSGQALGDLETLLEQVRQGRAQVEADVGAMEEAIEAMRSHLSAVMPVLRNLSQCVTTLRALAVLTRIESSRLVGGAHAEVVLEDEVHQHADAIAKRVAQFTEQSADTLTEIQQTQHRMRGLRTEESAAAAAALQRLASGASVLSRRHRAAREQAERTAQRAEALARDTGNVVAALQFHDITRQRLEHVASALRAGADRWHRIDGEGFCRFQATQVGWAREDLLRASAELLDSLRQIACNTESVMADVATADGDGQAHHEEAESRGLQDELEQALQAIREMDSLNHHLRGEVQRIWEQGSTCLETLAREVGAISEAIKRIALNAAVKADALGAEGVALAELAIGVQRLSGAVNGQAEAVAAKAAALNDTTAAPGRPTGPHDADSTERHVRELHGLLQGLYAGTEQRRALQARVREAGRTLSREINQAVDGFQVHTHMAAQLEDIEAHLLRLGGRRRRRANDAKQAATEALLAEMSTTYTMEREREAHTTRGRALAATAGMGAALEGAAMGGAAGSASQEAQEADDNIEWF